MFQRVALSVMKGRLSYPHQIVLSRNFCKGLETRYTRPSFLLHRGILPSTTNFSSRIMSLHTKGPLCDSNSSSSHPTSSSSSPPQTDWKKLTNEDWAERLSPEAYFCTREHGTEPPFSGQYVNHKAEGVYKCVCCGSELFTSKTKYDSGSGWPSFYAPAEEEGVIRRKDVSHGMVRLEILCATCNSHLGHVFDDGPEPTGERFCVNSVSLKFAPKKIN